VRRSRGPHDARLRGRLRWVSGTPRDDKPFSSKCAVQVGVLSSASTPSSVEVRDIARRTALRLHRAFQKQGRPSPWEEHAFIDSAESDPFSLKEPGLFACYQAAASGVAVSGEQAGQRLLRLLIHDQILWSAQQSLTPPRSRGAEACRPSALRAARRGR
jgi:hypothetical protein